MPVLKKSAIITPDLFPHFATKRRDGSIAFKVIRAGNPEDYMGRGGTWYEQQIYTDQRSRYSRKESLRSIPVGVGTDNVIRTEIVLNKPYVWNWTGEGNEAQAVVNLAKEVIPHDEFIRLTKGIQGRNAEKAFALIEHRMADILLQNGYDGIIFGDEHLYNTVLPKQIFKFTTNLR